jgi:hypothetical protein
MPCPFSDNSLIGWLNDWLPVYRAGLAAAFLGDQQWLFRDK